MKKKNRYLFVLVIFSVIMSIIIVFFVTKLNNIKAVNNAKDMLKDIYSLEEGEYDFIDGHITKDKNLVINKYYFDGNGSISVDKYGNVKMNINFNNKCIVKTSLGSVELRDECNYKKINASIVKNNSKISFILNENNLEYLISNMDDFRGSWMKQEYNDNLILNYYKEGKNYIWFKDSEGNISEALSFEVSCLNTNKAEYKNNIFYCSGSTVMIDKTEWVVLEDNNLSIKLMKRLPLEEKKSFCLNEVSNEYCFYTKSGKNIHKWSNSYINYYLNNDFYNKLSENVKNNIKEFYICDEYDNYKCDNESCGGRTRDEIQYNGWYCNKYVKSKVKLISYDDFNYAYAKSKDKKILSGNYLAINTFKEDKVSSIQYNNEFYILESPTKKLDIRPVILISK